MPGNYNAKATESFQEGFRVPPVKLISGGVFQQDIVDILAANSRVPLSNWGDLNGQLNALGLGEQRVHALLDEYGDETVAAATAALTARAEALMRANIASLPDGTYSYDDFLDNDGVTDEPLRIALDLTIAGETMRLDFSRSSPPCRGPLNIARSTAVACCYVALKHLFTDVPANAGCLAPIEFIIPDTTLLGVSAPKPVGGYTETILRVIDTVFGAFAQAAPERANGSPYRDDQCALARGLAQQRHALGHVLLLRRRPRRQSGRRRPQPRQQSDFDRDHSADGNSRIAVSGDVHAMGAAPGFRAAPDVIAAASAPSTRSRRWPTATPTCFCSASAESFRRLASTAARRLRSTAFSIRPTASERSPPLTSKITDVHIRRGQRVRLETPGGGGFGDPRTRDPARVARDVALGYVSRQAASRDYGVALCDDDSVDAPATAQLRGEARA